MTQPKLKKLAIALLTLTSASLVACGTPLTAIRPMAGLAPAIRALNGPTDAEKVFRNELASRKIQLTEAQIELIKTERHMKPSGLFAPRPAENLTAEQNLQVHFLKHKNEFPGVTTADQYRSQAVAFAGGQRGEVRFFFDTTSFKKGYQTHVVRWGPQSKEFSAVKTDGAVTTYYKNNSVPPNRFIPLGEL